MITALFSLAHVFTCTADFEADKILRSSAPRSLFEIPQKVVNADPSLRESIRITFDLSSITDHTKDSMQCYNGVSTSSETCQTTDELTAEKQNVIIETINNVKEYLESYVNVTRITDTWTLTSGYSGFEPASRSMQGVDLYLPVFARPFGASSSGLAYAFPNQYSTIDGRPVSGEIVLNPSKLPSSPQNFSSGARQFITTVLHEINHVLSFSQALFPRWINPDTNVSYGDNWKTVFVNDVGFTQTFVKGKNLVNWVNNRFGVSNSSISNFGLELEDGGGDGTAMSHPNERLYFTDLMQGRTYGPGYVSPILYNSLLDSGWYTPDPAMSEELVYLDSSINPSLSHTERILVDPPRKSFPSDYICSNARSAPCFYDHVYTGVCSLTDTTPSWDSAQRKWYNPNADTSYGTDELIDNTPIILPYLNCRDPLTESKRSYATDTNADTYGEVFDTDSVCAMSTLLKSAISEGSRYGRCYTTYCATDNKIRFKFGEEEYLCKYDGQQLTIPGYKGYVECPPAKVACANRQKREILNVLSLFPDRGPIDGKNLITINGYGFDLYEMDDLNISIGPVECSILQKKDNYILCKLDVTEESSRSSLLMTPQKFIGYVKSKNITTTISSMYTFTSRYYQTGSYGSQSALVRFLFGSF